MFYNTFIAGAKVVIIFYFDYTFIFLNKDFSEFIISL